MLPINQKRSRSDCNRSTYDGFAQNHHHFNFNRQNEIENDPSVGTSATRIVSDLQSALTTAKRLSALKRVQRVIICNNNDENSEYIATLVDAGIFHTLLSQINAMLHRHGSTLKELEIACNCVDIMLRINHSKQNELWSNVLDEGDGVMLILTKVLENLRFSECYRSRQFVDTSEIYVKKYVFSVLHSISSSAIGSSCIMQNQSLLFEIVDSLNVRFNLLNIGIALESLGILKNLSYYEEDRRLMLLQFESLLSRLTSLPHQLKVAHLNEESNDFDATGATTKSPLLLLSAVFRNISISSNCRGILARRPDFLSAVVDLVMLSDNETHTASNRFSILRNVLSIITSLAMESQDSTLLLLIHDNGIVLRVLKRLLGGIYVDDRESSDSVVSDQIVRKRAARIIRLLVNHTTSTLILHDTEIMTIISEVALHDPYADVRSEAAEAFAKIATFVIAQADDACCAKLTRHQKYHEAVLDALEALFVASSPENDDGTYTRIGTIPTPATLARAFKDQAYHESNRPLIIAREELVCKAASMALQVKDPFAVEDLCCAMMFLSQEKLSIMKLCQLPYVVDALVFNATEAPLIEMQVPTQRVRSHLKQSFSVTALLNLGSDENNMPFLANHPGLLQCLLQCAKSLSAGSATNSGNQQTFSLSKDDIKGFIQKLVEQL